MALSPTTHDGEEELQLSAFLKGFPPSPHHKQPESLWVFWSQKQPESKTTSLNYAAADDATQIVYDKIKSVFSKVITLSNDVIFQWWTPVTIGSRRLLSASGQPFAINHLHNNLKKYRLHSVNYQYNIDVNKQQLAEEDPMILTGGPASAFLNRSPQLVFLRFHQQTPLARYAASECELVTTFMLPICSNSQTSSCIGVVEASISRSYYAAFYFMLMKYKLQGVGLSIMFRVQERIPYKSINGLKPVSEEIKAALKIICVSHNLPLAQVWIACEDEKHVPFSSSVEDTQTKQILVKLTGYFNDKSPNVDEIIKSYYDTCDMVSLEAGVELVEKTLEDYEPRFCEDIENQTIDTLMASLHKDDFKISGLTICLRSIDTGYINYVFEFILVNISSYVTMLEVLLITLKRCLPSFKFASDAELGDELNVIYVHNSTDSGAENSIDAGGIKIIKIFQGNRVSPMFDALEKGKKPIVVDQRAASKAKHKIALKELSLQDIKQQYGNTQKVAARNLNVSLSTLKRKCHGFGIFEWQGPKVVKRKIADSCNYQRNRNEEDSGASQEPSVINRNEDTLTVKAEYVGDMIKFTFHISHATFDTVEEEIGKRFNMTPGAYKLKYLDEDEDLILLSSNQDMSDCIKSTTNSGRNVVRMRVIPSTVTKFL